MAVHAESNIQLNTIPAQTSLLGGHFVYFQGNTGSGGNTPASANVIADSRYLSIPAQWGYNTHIGANGIKLRNNEVTLSEWLANGFKIYNPIITNGVITDSKLGMTIGSDGVKFYKNEDSSNPIARFSDEGMFISPTTDFSGPRGFIIQKNAEYVLSTDTTVNVNKTYYTYSNNTYTEVANPSGNPSTQHYYEFSDYSINIFHKRATNDGPAAIATNNSFAWGEGKIRANTAAMTGVDEQGNPVASSVSIDAYYPTTATGRFSFAQGRGAEASGDYSVALGTCVKATQEGQLAIGQYSKVDNDALFIIGNGDEQISTLNGSFVSGDRNLFVVKKNGNLEIIDGFKIVNKDNSNTYLQLDDTNGLTVVKNNINIANFGSTVRIGQSTTNHLEIDSNGLTIKNTSNNIIAAFSASGINFSNSVPQHIGGTNNYIEFDNTTGRINIIGNGVYFGTTSIDNIATTENVNTAVNNLEIGGRNLHKNSNLIDSSWTIAGGSHSTAEVVTLTRASSETRIYQMPAYGYWEWQPNTTYTASIDVKGNSGGEQFEFSCNGGGTVTYISGRVNTVTTSWTRYKCTFTTGSSVSTGSMTYQLTSNNSTIQVRYPKLESGNKATDWSPAPEDVTAYTDTQINNIEIGGRNLLLNTSKTAVFQKAITAGSFATLDAYVMVTDYSSLDLVVGDYVTISFDWSITGVPSGTVTAKVGTNATPWEYFGIVNTYSAGSSSGHTEKSYKITSALASCTGTQLRFRIDSSVAVTAGDMVLTITNAKLEKGNKATDWTPAPEDLTVSKNLLGATANPTVPTRGNAAALSGFGTIGRYNSPDSEFTLEDYDGYANAIVITSSVTGNRGVSWYTKAGEVKAGETYTFSCKVKSSVSVSIHMHTAWRNGSATAGYVGWTSEGAKTISANTWTDYSYTFTPASNAQLDWEFLVAICFTGATTGVTCRIAHAKLEKGTRATDWSEAEGDGAFTAKNYITRIDGGGIKVHDAADATSYVKLNSSGMQVYQNNIEVANFGSTARIGQSTSSRFLVNSSSLQAYDSNNNKYFEITDGGMSADLITAGRLSSANGMVYFDLDNNEIACSKLVSPKHWESTTAWIAPTIVDISYPSTAYGGGFRAYMKIYEPENEEYAIKIEPYYGQYPSSISCDKQLDIRGGGSLGGKFSMSSRTISINPGATNYAIISAYDENGITEPTSYWRHLYLGGRSRDEIVATGSMIKLSGPVDNTGYTMTVGRLVVSGSKSRVVKTDNYQERLLYCYETPTPLFGDIGEAIIDEDGLCYVDIDDIFSETVAEDVEYQVFLQKEGQGDCWIADKQRRYFVIAGTPSLKVAWELKAKQKDYQNIRLEKSDNKLDEYDYEYVDYEMFTLDDFIDEQEELLYGNY